MSGQQIGTVVGGVIGAFVGFWAGGNVALGCQLGAAAGGAIGGYVDPEVIKGPKLSDPQQQTSAEGVPRAVIYGTAAVMGNVIQCQGTPTQHKKRQRTGKGGPVQETYTYTKTAAIRISEAAPLGGEMKLRRVWMNGKLAIDRTGTGQIDAESAKLIGEITFYSGSETQMPDPDLEALPAADGGGVGNVPAYRGSCYVVLRNVDVTQTQGALPQFMWEVSSEAEEVTSDTEWMFARASNSNTVTKNSPDGEDWSDSLQTVPLDEGGFFAPIGNGHLFNYGDEILATNNAAAALGGAHVTAFFDGASWHQTDIGTISAGDTAQIARSSSNWFVARHIASAQALTSTDGVTFSGLGFSAETIAPASSDRILAAWRNASNPNLINFSIRNADGTLSNTPLDLIPGFSPINLYMDGESGYALMAVSRAGTGSDVVVSSYMTTDSGLSWSAGGDLITVSTSATMRVHYGMGRKFLSVNNRIAIGTGIAAVALDPFVFPQTILGIDDDGTNVIVSGESGMLYSWTPDDGWQALSSGTTSSIFDVLAIGGCQQPAGSTPVPDMDGFYVTLDNEVVGCGTSSVTPGAVYLSDVVADQCERSGVTDYDVSDLSDIEVRGLALTQPVDAGGVIQALQGVYLFDFVEWGNSGETGTKLRAVLRGGASVATITDDDLIDGDDDETVRRQQVEFPRKVTLFAPDPDANYEATPQTVERESENVKATGEVSSSTAIVMTRDEKARSVDIMAKVLWEEAQGTVKLELPEEFTRLVPSDPIMYSGRRYRVSKTEQGDGIVTVEGTRDRASAYSSNATGNEVVALPPTQSGLRGPTMMWAGNLPSLRTSDNVPGMYVGVCGRLPGWDGCDLYLSTDGGETEQLVATIIDPATIGFLTSGIGAADEPLSVRLWADDELDSASATQIANRMNAFAVTTGGTSEIGQFETPTDTGDREWDLTDLYRGRLGTTAAAHLSGDEFALLDGSIIFLPIDISHAGKTLIFRPVSRGTLPENNATYSVVFSPLFTSVSVEQITEGGEAITVNGNPIYLVTQNA